MRILTVVGARPQFVKAAPVSRAIRENDEEVLLHTGQHYDDAMSEVFFRDLAIPAPDVNLGLGAGDAGARMAAMIRGISREISARQPDVVLVYGDTDSTQAGALAARACGVRSAHVEAGLRSFNLRMPEELNRIAADHLAALLLCPTESSAARLRVERAAGRIEVVGDVMLDACLAVADAAKHLDVARRHGVEPGAYYAATLHRAENTDDPARLASITSGLDSLDLPVLLPCHPRTAGALRGAGLGDGWKRLRLLPPLSYPEMIGLLASARALLTDSGGLQKEAYFLSVPCVTLREETEWTETVSSGWNRLAGADPDRIRAAAREAAAQPSPPSLESFGGGRAAVKVARALHSMAV